MRVETTTNNRKAMAYALAERLGAECRYMGTPTYAYRVGNLTIERDGAIIGANSVVTKDVPPYCIAGGNPCRMIRRRFDDELIAYLLDLKWWDWDAGKIFRNMEALCSGDLTKIRSIAD